MRKIVFAIGLWCLLAAVPAWAKLPEKPEGRVSDFAEMLTEAEEAEIQSLAERLEKASGVQLAVVTVTSLDGLTVEDYANRLFAQWGIGHPGKHDGVLLLVALQEKKARIEVGYGLEGVLNDGKVGRILDESVMPGLQAMEYGRSLLAGSRQIAAAIAGDAVLQNTAAPQPAAEPDSPLATGIFALVLGVFATAGGLAFGAGFRGNMPLIFWGALFGGFPAYLATVTVTAMKFPPYATPAWVLLMVLIGIVFGQNAAKKIKVSVGVRAGGRSSTGSRGGSSASTFGGGSSGGGGASR